jgi:hypothetical protein
MGYGMGIAQGSRVMIKLKVTQWDDSAWKKRDKVYIALW